MREIKFKAWWKSKKLMIRDYAGTLNDRGLYVASWDNDTPDLILMQYTGLKDKNGTEIYEGDVVKWTQTLIETGLQKFIGKVEFYEGAYWIDNDEKAICLFDESNPVEVIGNIYENPELLKDG